MRLPIIAIHGQATLVDYEWSCMEDTAYAFTEYGEYYVYYRSNNEYVIDQLNHQIYPCIAKRLYKIYIGLSDTLSGQLSQHFWLAI